MKLIDAPVIAGEFPENAPWLVAAAEETRKRFVNPPTENRQGVDQRDFTLKQLAEDIWAIDGPLGIHTDKTRRGFRVIGLVLVNEIALSLATGDRIFPLPVGTIYHIDGRAPHGALIPMTHHLLEDENPQNKGLFGFMAWDVHRNVDLDELIDSIPDAMRAFADGEERIDVSTITKLISELK